MTPATPTTNQTTRITLPAPRPVDLDPNPADIQFVASLGFTTGDGIAADKRFTASRPDRVVTQPKLEIVGQRLRRSIAVRGCLLEAFQADHLQIAVRPVRLAESRGRRPRPTIASPARGVEPVAVRTLCRATQVPPVHCSDPVAYGRLGPQCDVGERGDLGRWLFNGIPTIDRPELARPDAGRGGCRPRLANAATG
jgi:hypothetical protein